MSAAWFGVVRVTGRLMTIVSDACTIHKKPLTNYVAKCTNEPEVLIKYEDATKLYQDDGIKEQLSFMPSS